MTSRTVVLRTLRGAGRDTGAQTFGLGGFPGGARRRGPAAGCAHVVAVWRSIVSGVYPVMRKWQRGVGMSDAMSPTRSLFMYPG